ncbi:hypothetical protein LXL04_035304 [Taraxacum kok-saghyz]
MIKAQLILSQTRLIFSRLTDFSSVLTEFNSIWSSGRIPTETRPAPRPGYIRNKTVIFPFISISAATLKPPLALAISGVFRLGFSGVFRLAFSGCLPPPWDSSDLPPPTRDSYDIPPARSSSDAQVLLPAPSLLPPARSSSSDAQGERSPVEDDRKTSSEEEKVEEDVAGVCLRRRWSQERTFASEMVACGRGSRTEKTTEKDGRMTGRRRNNVALELAGNRMRERRKEVTSKPILRRMGKLGFYFLYTRVVERVEFGSGLDRNPTRNQTK